MNTDLLNKIFAICIEEYHRHEDVNMKCPENNDPDNIEKILYKKCWIDTVQWHLEDIIRDVNIEPTEALNIKRKIDVSNQHRTDLVEQIDEYIYHKFATTDVKNDARINTETPAWAIDRLAILNLKIYHMKQETTRTNCSDSHLQKCTDKLNILLQQKIDLSKAIDMLLNDLLNGDCIAKTYKQMKMYNDPELNPILRKNIHNNCEN